MASNAQKIPFQSALNRFATRKVADLQQQLGKSLPCSVVSVNNSIVTVKFELDSDLFTLPQITIPVFGPEYIRYPLQVGDKGVTVATDLRLGGVSGLGSGNASLTPPSNLTALYFMPIANANWSATDDPNRVVIYGPNGAVLRSTNGPANIVVGLNDVYINGTLWLNGFAYLGHKHIGVQTGGGTSGPVTP